MRNKLDVSTDKVKEYLEQIMMSKNYQYYFHDNKLFFLKDNINEIDLEFATLKIQTSNNIREVYEWLLDSIEYDVFSKPSINRIIPVLFTTEDLEGKGNILRYETLENGNIVAFMDSYLGEGRYINIGDFESYKSLISQAFCNLDIYFSGEIKFEETYLGSEVYKLTEPMHSGQGRSIMLMPQIQLELERLFGGRCKVILSDRGHLYVCNNSIDLDKIILTLFKGKKQWLENLFEVFTFIKGKYTKVSYAYREIKE